MSTQQSETIAMEHVQTEHGSAATAAGPIGPNDTQRNAIHESNATQNSNNNNATIIHNGVLPTDAAMMPATAAPHVLFMSSGASTPSPTMPRRRSLWVTPPSGAPRAQNSPLTTSRAVRRRAGPSDLGPDYLDEALRAIQEQQRQDRNAIARLNLLVEDQAKALEAQRKWNEENSRRVLAMEGSVQAAAVDSNRYAKSKADELKETLESVIPKAIGDVESKIAQRLDDIEKFIKAQGDTMSKFEIHTTTRLNAVEQTILMAAGPAPHAVSNDSAVMSLAARLSDLESTVKAQADAVSMQQVYLQGLHSSKPGEVQSLATCFA